MVNEGDKMLKVVSAFVMQSDIIQFRIIIKFVSVFTITILNNITLISNH